MRNASINKRLILFISIGIAKRRSQIEDDDYSIIDACENMSAHGWVWVDLNVLGLVNGRSEHIASDAMYVLSTLL